MKKYPKTIYIIRENAGDGEEYLNVLDSPENVALDDNVKREVMEYVLSPVRHIVEKKVSIRKFTRTKK